MSDVECPDKNETQTLELLNVNEYIGSCKGKEMTGYGSNEMEKEKPMSTRKEEEK